LWNRRWKWRNDHGRWGNGNWWEYHWRRGGNHLRRERWDRRRFDGATKDIGHLHIGIEDGWTKGEWVMERGSIGALKEVKHVFCSLFEIAVARELRKKNFSGKKSTLKTSRLWRVSWK
jgi:hypothetical protein